MMQKALPIMTVSKQAAVSVALRIERLRKMSNSLSRAEYTP